jgi:aryl-alcohol dehydrogenase-like predicted oxidoreductase
MPVQIIFNLLEQVLGEAIGPAAQAQGVPVLVRVPHASGVLEGVYTEQTEFAPTDHRSHRVTTDEGRRQWLIDGLQKLERLRFATADAGRTPGQMAIQWLLSQPAVTSLFPNIYDARQLEEFAAAPSTPAFTAEELIRVQDLYRNEFYLRAEPTPA